MSWCLIVVLICIPLIISDIEHLFTCFMAICISTLEKWIYRSSAHFLVELFCFVTELHKLCVFWRLIPCQTLCLQIFFPPILRTVSSFCVWFPLLYKSFWVWLGPICLFLFHYSRKWVKKTLLWFVRAFSPCFPLMLSYNFSFISTNSIKVADSRKTHRLVLSPDTQSHLTQRLTEQDLSSL